LADKRHVVLPADGGADVDADAADGGADRAEGGGGALGPDEAFSSGGHDFAALPDDAELGTDVDGGAVHAAAGFFNKAGDEEDASYTSYALEFLAGSVATLVGDVVRLRFRPRVNRITLKLSIHPGGAGTGSAVTNGVSEVDCLFEVVEVFISPLVGAGAHDTPEGGATGISTDESLGEEEDIDLFGGGTASNLLDLDKSQIWRQPVAGRSRAKPDFGG
jgi:hypothetical protein